MIIAIDGPAGSGKSTVARIVANKLQIVHIESGAMYRAVAWRSLQEGVDLSDENAVAGVAQKINTTFVPGPDGQSVLVAGDEVTRLLKEEAISRAAAMVAAQPGVRDVLTVKQRELGVNGNLVMDGRDIGTVVFPQADKKIFLDADPGERGKRRYLELKAKNQDVDLNTIIEEVKKRDYEDRNRTISPLKPAEDAIQLDTTHLQINEVVDEVMRLIQSPPAA
ncbi:MAG: (d)CMP kinase [Nitrospinaceae bacterium]